MNWRRRPGSRHAHHGDRRRPRRWCQQWVRRTGGGRWIRNPCGRPPGRSKRSRSAAGEVPGDVAGVEELAGLAVLGSVGDGPAGPASRSVWIAFACRSWRGSSAPYNVRARPPAMTARCSARGTDGPEGQLELPVAAFLTAWLSSVGDMASIWALSGSAGSCTAATRSSPSTM